jgi:hypothetical protein
MKKPAIIDNVIPPSSLLGSLTTSALGGYKLFLGEVTPWVNPDVTSEPLNTLSARLGSYGLRGVQRGGYRSAEALRVDGAVGPHEDIGLGLVLNWFLGSCEPYSVYMPGETPTLATPWGLLPIKVGDVFLFNADETHSWIHNGSCYLLQMTVSKVKTPATRRATVEA